MTNPESSTMIQELLKRDREEGRAVGTKLQEFIKESKRKLHEIEADLRNMRDATQ